MDLNCIFWIEFYLFQLEVVPFNNGQGTRRGSATDLVLEAQKMLLMFSMAY